MIIPTNNATDVNFVEPVIFTFNEAMNPSTLTAQSLPGPCADTLQVSGDGFATCLGFGETGVILSTDQKTAEIIPSPALSFGSSYQIKLLGSVASVGGATFGSDLIPVTFTTELPGPATCTGSVVISQIFGGSGSGGAVASDFVELLNRGGTPIPLGGMSIQYQTAGGTSWSVAAQLSGTLQPGSYYLVALNAGGGTAPLPTADATGSTNLSASQGKVALVQGTSALTDQCPTDGSILDVVAYGTTSTVCREGSANASGGSATRALLRGEAGCTDDGINNSDFSTGAPNPRNTSSPAALCTCAGSPTQNESGAATEANYCVLSSPATIPSISAGSVSPLIRGQVLQAGVTPTDGGGPVLGQVGYGPVTVNPEDQVGWVWIDAALNAACSNCGEADEYQGEFTAPDAGTYFYGFRVSVDDGATWTYCDLDGAGSNPGFDFSMSQLPTFEVTP